VAECANNDGNSVHAKGLCRRCYDRQRWREKVKRGSSREFTSLSHDERLAEAYALLSEAKLWLLSLQNDVEVFQHVGDNVVDVSFRLNEKALKDTVQSINNFFEEQK
jgi:hypothetical protein